MDNSTWVIAAATFLGPIFAVYAAGIVERRRRAHDQKLGVFRTLMATRQIPLAPRHVEALNVIDVVYGSKAASDASVRNAWKAYLDHLNHAPQQPSDAWGAKQIELLVDLLSTMASNLGFNYDKTHIKNQAYWPKYLGDVEWQQWTIRAALVDVLTQNKPVTIHIDNVPQPAAHPPAQQ
jgi:hypothetical protein